MVSRIISLVCKIPPRSHRKIFGLGDLILATVFRSMGTIPNHAEDVAWKSLPAAEKANIYSDIYIYILAEEKDGQFKVTLKLT